MKKQIPALIAVSRKQTGSSLPPAGTNRLQGFAELQGVLLFFVDDY